jgi:alpha-glucoside transport system substrate-binding protein
MAFHNWLRAFVLPVLVVVLSAAACTANADPHIGGTVTVVGSWSGAEEDSFLAMVQPFEQQTGISVQYTGTRDLNGLLWQGVAQKNPPDVAGLPGPGQMAEFARFGALQDLTGIIDVSQYKNDTVPTFIDLGTVDGKLVGVFIKATLKGLIWYNPKVYTIGAPATWSALQADAQLARREANTWCVALGSDATSGWPGTDWIEDFVLRQSGPEVYDDWVSGRLPWTSQQIKEAFQNYGNVIADAAGGASNVIATGFQDGGNGLFSDPPTCLFHHQATFMTEFFKSQAGARDGEYDFFPFPALDPRFANDVTGAGDLFGMFRNTPQSRALMSYLLTPEAQSIWVARGGALSVNVNVTNYPDSISKRAAQILTSADRFRFDGSDLMPETLNEAFLQGVIEYTRSPAELDQILAQLDTISHDGASGP